MSILEEATVAALRPMMRVCNNLVIYRQDVPKSVGIGDPDLANSWSWSEEGNRILHCLKVLALPQVRPSNGYRTLAVSVNQCSPIGRSRTDQTLKTKRTCEARVPIERAQLLFWTAIHRTAGPHRVTTSPTARNICGAVVLSHRAIVNGRWKETCRANTCMPRANVTERTC
jgi:hypothetical protein